MVELVPRLILTGFGQQALNALFFPSANRLLQHVKQACVARQISHAAAIPHGDKTCDSRDKMLPSLPVSASHAPKASGDLQKMAPNFATTGVKKTFYKRKLPCPPATEFSSPEGKCHHKGHRTACQSACGCSRDALPRLMHEIGASSLPQQACRPSVLHVVSRCSRVRMRMDILTLHVSIESSCSGASRRLASCRDTYH
jgi:hypothetical protein